MNVRPPKWSHGPYRPLGFTSQTEGHVLERAPIFKSIHIIVKFSGVRSSSLVLGKIQPIIWSIIMLIKKHKIHVVPRRTSWDVPESRRLRVRWPYGQPWMAFKHVNHAHLVSQLGRVYGCIRIGMSMQRVSSRVVPLIRQVEDDGKHTTERIEGASCSKPRATKHEPPSTTPNA